MLILSEFVLEEEGDLGLDTGRVQGVARRLELGSHLDDVGKLGLVLTVVLLNQDLGVVLLVLVVLGGVLACNSKSEHLSRDRAWKYF